MSGALLDERQQAIPSSGQDPEEFSYVVAYARVLEDKADGIYVQGVFFGGLGSTPKEAERIARDCVNTARGGTIIPRIVPAGGKLGVLDALDKATRQFNRMESQMYDAEEIINRSCSRKPHKSGQGTRVCQEALPGAQVGGTS